MLKGPVILGYSWRLRAAISNHLKILRVALNCEKRTISRLLLRDIIESWGCMAIFLNVVICFGFSLVHWQFSIVR